MPGLLTQYTTQINLPVKCLNNTQIYHVKSRQQEMAVYLEYIILVVIEIHENGHKTFDCLYM